MNMSFLFNFLMIGIKYLLSSLDIVSCSPACGLIPARIIRNYIKKPIYVVTLSLYDECEKKNEKNEINVIQWVDLELKDKKVVIIDEVDDTRQTMDYCIQRLKLVNNANNIGVFVLHNKLKSKVGDLSNIHYMSCETIEDKWVVYPWD